jgi:7-carboxy-7-deazaguanine synthase
MRICEIYSSIQGEGVLTGTPSIFLRTSGCNLRCWFCDTPFASWEPEGENLTLPEILDQVMQYDCQHVVITGGEPMLWSELSNLCQELRRIGRHITIETAGTVFQPVACDLMSISPKLANSTPSQDRAGDWRQRHEQTRHRPDVVQRLMSESEYQLKFVIDTPDDGQELLAYLGNLVDVDSQRVLLMPQGMTESELDSRSEWLLPFCQSHGFRFCDRAHIRWFGSKRGT